VSSIRGVGTVLSDFDGIRSIFLADKPYGLGDETVSERNAAENGTITGATINVNEQFTNRRYSFVYDGWYLEEKDYTSKTTLSINCYFDKHSITQILRDIEVYLFKST